MLSYKIAITGRFRTGKDTLADILQELIKQEGGEVTTLHFADALKREVATMAFDFLSKEGKEDYFDFEHAMLRERHLNGLAWQWWGEWRRQHHGEDYWINHEDLQRSISIALARGSSIIISDMRHHNEATWCQEHGFYLIRVAGPCRAEGEPRDPNHPSEIHIDDLEVDAVIDNRCTLKELKTICKHFFIDRVRRRAQANLNASLFISEK